MNRREEYDALLHDLEQTPPELNYTMTRVEARVKREKARRSRRWLGTSLASLGGLLTAFALIVNFSIPVAMACLDKPFLRELMSAVAFSDTLKAMVQNDFVQQVNQTKAADRAEMTIHYLVYDGSEINIFYSASYNGSKEVELEPDYTHPDGSHLGSMSWSSGRGTEKGEISHLSMSVHRGDPLPTRLKMKVDFYPLKGYWHETGEAVPMPAPTANTGIWDQPSYEEQRGESVATLEFELTLQEEFLKAKRSYTPNARVELGDRVLFVEEVVVYPTGTQLVIRQDEGNDATVSGLEMWLEDGKGNRIKQGKNGLVSVGTEDALTTNYFLDSVYFSPDSDLTLCIDRARWLEKGKERAALDLVNVENSALPEGLSLTEVRQTGPYLELTFRNGVHGGNFASGWYDENGELHYFNMWGSRDVGEEEAPPVYEDFIYVPDYEGDTMEIKLNWTEQVDYDPPVKVRLG